MVIQNQVQFVFQSNYVRPTPEHRERTALGRSLKDRDDVTMNLARFAVFILSLQKPVH
jgi:hypothetical protein